MGDYFRTDNKQTKEEFLAQLAGEPEEIVVLVRWTWQKGDSKFPSFGKEDLVHIVCAEPKNEEGRPVGIGTVYWFSKKKLFGYPYTPCFTRNECYRLRVRRCKTGYNYFLLEDILESNADVSSADVNDKTVFWNRKAKLSEPETPEQAAMYADRIQKPDGLFAGVDLSALFDNNRKIRSRYEFPKVTNEWIERTEKAIGYKISPAYRELLEYQNGGEIRDDSDKRWLTAIFGIGPKPDASYGLEEKFDDCRNDLEYPDIGIPFGETNSGGHDMYYMDYRVVDSNGEPRIVIIDNELDNQITFAANNLVEFIKIVLANSEMTTRGERLD